MSEITFSDAAAHNGGGARGGEAGERRVGGGVRGWGRVRRRCRVYYVTGASN